MKGKGRLTPEARAAYRQIDLHFHDLRHQAGSRLLEAGWPLHYVQHMLGPSNIAPTGTHLNATLQGMKALMRPKTEQGGSSHFSQ